MIRLAIAAALALAPASADPLAGRVAGAPVRCLDVSRIGGPDIVDNHTILYRDGATLYRAAIEACPALRPLSTLVVDVYGSRICRGDRFRVVTPGLSIPSPDCRFDMFVPYTKVTARSD